MNTINYKTSVLGKTNLKVGRLGLAASYGAPARAYEEAFDKGCNYFYMGGGRKRAQMKKAIRNLISQGHREKMVISIQTYARLGLMTELFFKQTLKSLGINYADVMILGWHNSVPFSMLLEFAYSMREKGLCKFIGMSGHNRSLFPEMEQKQIEGKNVFDLFHIRYNAAHRGAQKDCFPFFDSDSKPGIVSYTATRWGHLLDHKKMPEGETALRARDCYRFALTSPHIDLCLCGPKDIPQMHEALRALDEGPLNDDELKRIKLIGDHVRSHGSSFFS